MRSYVGMSEGSDSRKSLTRGPHKDDTASQIVQPLKVGLDRFAVLTSLCSIGNFQDSGTVYFPLLEEDQGAVSVFQRKLLHFRPYPDFSRKG
jgi:hypothetical protein